MDERVHVAGVEVVLLVPGRGRQHDVRIQAGRAHAEIERHQQVELARRLVVPLPLRSALASSAKILALHAIAGAQQMLEEIFVPLAARPSRIWSATQHVARPVGRWSSGSSQLILMLPFGPATSPRTLGPYRPAAASLDDLHRVGLSCGATAASPCARRARCSRSCCRGRRPCRPGREDLIHAQLS